MRASGAAINMRGIKNRFRTHDRFLLSLRDSRSQQPVYTMEQQYLPNILQDQTLVSGAQDL